MEPKQSKPKAVRTLAYLQGCAESRPLVSEKADKINPYLVQAMNHSELGIILLCPPKIDEKPDRKSHGYSMFRLD